MILDVFIKDIVLVDQVHLDVPSGLTAVTGETGAGKSAFLAAIALAVGAKGDRGLVRAGASEGVAAVTFEVSAKHAVHDVLAAHGLETDDGRLTLRRVQASDGRSRGFVNDQPASMALLRALGAVLVEIHGQHQSVGLLDSCRHRALLDDFGGHGAKRRRVSLAWRSLQQADNALTAHRKRTQEARRDDAYIRHVAEELSVLGARIGEEGELAQRRATLMAAEKIAEDLRGAMDVLENEGPVRALSAAAAQVDRAAGRCDDADGAPLQNAVDRLDIAVSELAAARDSVLRAAESYVHDPEELNAVEERLFSLRAAARKYGRPVDSLPAYLAEIEMDIVALDDAEAAESELEAALASRKQAYDEVCAELSRARARAGKRLAGAVMRELAPLKLAGARFGVELALADTPGADGHEQVVFQLAANPGAPLVPLGGGASGGELARVVLAIKAALAHAVGRSVIVFDEIDSGVGGAVADAVGERLARIADGGQVLVVTHSPQVAARAEGHFQVVKSGQRQARTGISALSPVQRVDEIARMLAGAVVTENARSAARDLMGGLVEEKPSAKKVERAKVAA